MPQGHLLFKAQFTFYGSRRTVGPLHGRVLARHLLGTAGHCVFRFRRVMRSMLRATLKWPFLDRNGIQTCVFVSTSLAGAVQRVFVQRNAIVDKLLGLLLDSLLGKAF